MRSVIMIIMLAFMISGCATTMFPMPKVEKVSMTSVFKPEQAAYVLEKGNNTVTGQSFLKTMIGEVRTCAGNEAELIPVSDYSTEIMMFSFRNTESGYSPANYDFVKTLDVQDKRWLDYRKVTYCDAQGNFKFDDVKDGEYYIRTLVVWQIPGRFGFEGGSLMKRVKVAGGQTVNLFVLGK